jgi:hypothetical protein
MDDGRRLPSPGHAESSPRLCPAAHCSGAALPACAGRCSACTVQRPHTRAVPARRIFSRRPDARHLTRCLTRRARARRHAAARRCRASRSRRRRPGVVLGAVNVICRSTAPVPFTNHKAALSLVHAHPALLHRTASRRARPPPTPGAAWQQLAGKEAHARRARRRPRGARGAARAISVQPQHAGSPAGRLHRCADAEMACLLRTASAATLCDAAQSSNEGGASPGWRWRMRQAAAAVGRPRARRRRIRRVRATLAAACGKRPLGLGHGMQHQRRMPQHRQRHQTRRDRCISHDRSFGTKRQPAAVALTSPTPAPSRACP